jgi:hypothetical protein
MNVTGFENDGDDDGDARDVDVVYSVKGRRELSGGALFVFKLKGIVHNLLWNEGHDRLLRVNCHDQPNKTYDELPALPLATLD